MATYFLPVFRKNAFLEISEKLPAVATAAVDLEGILAFCQWYRIQGICGLFLEGRSEPLLRDLHKSGRAFLHYLVQVPTARKATSRSGPFFDAIASGDFECAREISRNSRLTWNADEELEDDFCYVQFLMKHFFLNGTPADCEAILQRFEQVLDGATAPRFDVCQAFAADDSQLFAAALTELLQGHEALYQEMINEEILMAEEAATESKLCVEGLAIVRLAELKQFPLDDDYLLLPSTARETAAFKFGADDWKTP